MAPNPRGGHPAPSREQAQQQRQGGVRTTAGQQTAAGGSSTAGGQPRRGSSGGGVGNSRRPSAGAPPPAASRAVNTNQRTGGRRPSLREAAQAPWRSSLDLVWSYSRSQAFYGDNFASSPSFVDRHWAGPSVGGAAALDSSVEETSEDEEEEELSEDDEDYVDDEDEEEAYIRQRMTHEHAAYMAQSPAGPMEWNDEQLPPNAIPPQRSALGRREYRDIGEPSPGRRGDSSGAALRFIDRNIRRITDDSAAGEDERSRSRSRSPKRTGLSRLTPSSGLRPLADGSRQQMQGGGNAARLLHSQLTSSTGAKRLAYGENSLGDEEESRRGRRMPSLNGDAPQATESTPLLAPAVHDNSTQHQRPALRTPSWFRDSHMSVSSSKYRMQGYGTSTFWQSWFNTVNALVGVGILALPLAISYAGLIPGILLFLLCGMATNYTGKVLAHIMAAEPTLRTYADIGNLAFGPRGRVLVATLFCLELWAVSTALIILFGDSVRALIISESKAVGASRFLQELATWSPAAFKAFGVLLVLPTMFLSLRLLSPISVIGIVSVVTLFVVVVSDGLIKPHAPGSLHEIIPPSLAPQWTRLPLSFGLIMSGFSSHPIIPSLFKDMRDPKRFCAMLDWAYVAATIIYLAMGVIGYLMFGNSVSDEITRDISQSIGYPRWMNTMAICLIIVNPLSKFALAARPVVTTLEVLLGVEQSQERANVPKQNLTKKGYNSIGQAARTATASVSPDRQNGDVDVEGEANGQDGTTSPFKTTVEPASDEDAHSNGSATPRAFTANESSPLVGSMISIRAAQRTAQWSHSRKVALRIAIHVAVALLVGATAIALPGFEKVMAFLGAFLACATCVFGPLAAKLILFRTELSRLQIALDLFVLLLFVAIAITGTVWSFLPIGAASILVE